MELDFVSCAAAAAYLGVSERTVQRYLERGKLAGREVRHGETVRREVAVSSLRAYRGDVSPGTTDTDDRTDDTATVTTEATVTEVSGLPARLGAAELAELVTEFRAAVGEELARVTAETTDRAALATIAAELRKNTEQQQVQLQQQQGRLVELEAEKAVLLAELERVKRRPWWWPW